MLRNSKLASAKGGVLDVVSPQGEVLISVAVPPGLVDAAPYFDMADGVGEVQISAGLVEIAPKGGFTVCEPHPAFGESGANPDFVPSSDQSAALARMVEQLRVKSDHLERRVRAFGAIERVPQAAASAPAKDEPLVE